VVVEVLHTNQIQEELVGLVMKDRLVRLKEMMVDKEQPLQDHLTVN
tara:strand:- start:326 stop:463 length:138 start_codon:yes stop_codon:yes gene_type:complete